MKKWSRFSMRVASVFFALVMCVSMLKLTVFAAEGDPTDTITGHNTAYDPTDLNGWREFANQYQNEGNGWSINQFDPNKSYDVNPDTKLPIVNDEGKLVERDFHDASEVVDAQGNVIHTHHFQCLSGGFQGVGSDGFTVLVSGIWACGCGEVVYSNINVIDGRVKPTASPTTPVDSEPVDSEPVDSEPVDSEPVDSEPVDSEPVDSEPVDSEPVDSEPVDSEPVDSEPVDSEPVDSEPVDSEPVDSEPVDSEPVDSEPVDSEPVDSEPVDSEPVDSEPVSSDPARSTDPGTVEIHDPDVPLEETPEFPKELVEIAEPEVPLAEIPPEEVEIDEPEVPLADVPQTGDESLFWICSASLSGTGLVSLVLAGRKHQNAEK